MTFPIYIALALLISSYANAIEFDYCVADLALPTTGPFGYLCKDPAKLTAEDFSYSGLRTPSNLTQGFQFGFKYALAAQFPGLNGLDISMARADIGVGGAIPLHTHRVAELAILIEGTIIAGFIDTNNKAFYKTLNSGDMFVFPPTLEHFVVNIGKTPVVAYASFPSSNPGFQGVSLALFRNDLPTDIIQKVTLLDPEQIKKLKAAFGGTN